MENLNITSAQYVVDHISDSNVSIRATIDGQEMFVGIDPANRHYSEIMRQVEAGELTIAPADT